MNPVCRDVSLDAQGDVVVVGNEEEIVDEEWVHRAVSWRLGPADTEPAYEAIELEGNLNAGLRDIAVGGDGQVVAVGWTRSASSEHGQLIVSLGPRAAIQGSESGH